MLLLFVVLLILNKMDFGILNVAKPTPIYPYKKNKVRLLPNSGKVVG